MTTTNGDSLCQPPVIPPPEYEQGLIIVVYGLVSIGAIAGNAIVCFIVASFERMRKTENFFIFNLALTDMIMACLCTPFTFVPSLILGFYPFGWLMCKVMNYSQLVTVLVSSWTLVAIAVERYLGVVFPFRPKMRRRKALLVMCLTWILALAVALPTVIHQELVEHVSRADGQSKTHCMEKWDGMGADGSSYQSYVYGMILMTLQYFLPVGILIFTYSTIAIHVWGMKTPGEALKDRDKKLKDEKMRMTKMMVVVVLLYVISWLPLNAYNVISMSDQYANAMYCYKYIHYVWFACHWLAMSHATLNPIIYFWMNCKFRAGFIYALKYLFCCRRQSDEWLIDKKLIGGYSRSTIKITQVFNKYDSISQGNVTSRKMEPNKNGQLKKVMENSRPTLIDLSKGQQKVSFKEISQPEAAPLMAQVVSQSSPSN